MGYLTKSTSRTGDTVAFAYERSWLEDKASVRCFPLDHQLYLSPGALYATAGADRVTPIFEDCSPDRWGKLLMDRREAIEAREESRKVRNLRDWEYLVGVNDETRMGALRLRDPFGSPPRGRRLQAGARRGEDVGKACPAIGHQEP